jgi:hypothetical protein
MTAPPGFALVFALVILAALSIAAAGMVAIGAREAEIAGAMARRADSRLAAESAAAWALATWSTREHGALVPGEASGRVDVGRTGSNLPPTVEAGFVVTRLGPALFAVHGIGHHADGGPPATARAGVLVRTVDPDSLAMAFPAAVTAETEALVDAGFVAGDAGCADPRGVPAPLGGPGVLAPNVTVAPAATVTGEPPVLLAPPPVPASGILEPPLIDALATVPVAGGSVTPIPRVRGEDCQADEANWGAVAPSSPCYDHLPLVRAAGDLTVRGGEGRGLLIVDGDLVLDGVRFHGVVLVRGRVTIRAGAVVRGAVRASTVRIVDGSVAHDPCHVSAALTAGGLDGPFRVPDRLWVPVF